MRRRPVLVAPKSIGKHFHSGLPSRKAIGPTGLGSKSGLQQMGLAARNGAAATRSLCSAEMGAPNDVGLEYPDHMIAKILTETKTIAMVGASDNSNRPSYFAFKYLQRKGYRVIPVNPVLHAKGISVLGEPAVATLADIPGSIDMVDIFRNSEAALEITKEAINLKNAKEIKTVWMQFEVINHNARALAESHGLQVVMDRCPKVEFARLFGEIGTLGFNSKVISSKRCRPGVTNDDESANRVEFSGFETKSIHAGFRPDADTGARIVPIYQTSSYVFDDVEEAKSLFNLQAFGNIYTRMNNPTVASLEEKLAALEGGIGATCTSSGHAAQVLLLFTLLRPGDHFVASSKLYGGSITQFKKMGEKCNWHVDFVDMDDLEDVRKKLAHPRCKFLWVESLSNPEGIMPDISGLAKEAAKVKVPLIVDNTIATPYLCRPKELGADIVVHSTTKYLSGHGNALGGVVVDCGTFDWSSDGLDKYPSLTRPDDAYNNLTFYETFGKLGLTVHLHAVGLRDLGPCMAPMNAFLTTTGLETLALRMQRHCENALGVAKFLESHPAVKLVSYSGLPASRYFERTMKNTGGKGAGASFTMELNGDFSDGIKFVQSCQLFSHLANVGDVRSLILHPASTTHSQLNKEERVRAGITDGLIRLSVGIETLDDLVKDLSQALDKIRTRSSL